MTWGKLCLIPDAARVRQYKKSQEVVTSIVLTHVKMLKIFTNQMLKNAIFLVEFFWVVRHLLLFLPEQGLDV
jgi:hypothetical protein